MTCGRRETCVWESMIRFQPGLPPPMPWLRLRSSSFLWRQKMAYGLASIGEQWLLLLQLHQKPLRLLHQMDHAPSWIVAHSLPPLRDWIPIPRQQQKCSSWIVSYRLLLPPSHQRELWIFWQNEKCCVGCSSFRAVHRIRYPFLWLTVLPREAILDQPRQLPSPSASWSGNFSCERLTLPEGISDYWQLRPRPSFRSYSSYAHSSYGEAHHWAPWAYASS
mmetsp:Transcript_38102/g.66834  ORF Transcript_38102/g.66834 Transcript_38102/m.66834 type:complete len:220 (-) Transcript_38102:771-1430(-)